MTTATIVPKHIMPGHFTVGKQYLTIYEIDGEDQGWFTFDDAKAKHWLSPWDGKDHSNIYHEPWINQNFIIVEAK